MVALVLGNVPTDAAARSAVWRQLIDLSAQAGGALSPATRTAVDDALGALRRNVPDDARRAVAVGLAARVRDPATVRAFADDSPAVAAPVLARAQLTPGEWLALLPQLPPPARAILRNRRDLAPEVARALRAFGPGDIALGTPTLAADERAQGGSQIVELVARIEAFRAQTPAPKPAGAHPGFAFETDAQGVIDWVDGVLRSQLVGLAIAEEAPPQSPGVDGQAAGAFRRRAPITAARLVVRTADEGDGVWLISASPMFDPRSGRFAGYHGSGRRPRADELAAPRRSIEALTAVDPDALRQIVHELRTPLNAVQGFAEMIDAQLLGPVSRPYRDRAAAIVGDARALLQVVDDLDTAARLDGGRLDAPAESAAVGAIVLAVAADLRALADSRGARIAITLPDAMVVTASAMLVDRIVRRLAGNAIALAEPAETIAVVGSVVGGVAALAVSRPAVLAGVAEAALLDPDFGPDGDWPDAPLLGLGFTIRLVARIAHECGAQLAIERDWFRVRFADVEVCRGESVPNI